MWARNLLFAGLLLGGSGLLLGNLLPSKGKAAQLHVPPPSEEIADTVRAVDGELRKMWAEQKLSPTAEAPDLAVARRLSLALLGVVPSLEEIRAFEKQPAQQRISNYLETILQDRRFADYFAERFTRAFVGTEDGPFIVFRRRRFRAWISDELMKHRPYDEIVRELIASEGLWTDKPPTNFVTVTYDPEKKKIDAERLAARVARAFLGIRIDCAQCHDHPFQDWKQQDFHRLAAFFGQTHQGFTGIYDGDGEHELENRRTGEKKAVAPQVPFDVHLTPQEGTRRQRLAGWLTDPRNPGLARATVNRVWALLFSRPLVDPVDDLGSVEKLPKTLTILADDFASHGYDLRRLIRIIVASEAFRRESVSDGEITEAHEATWAAFPLTRLRPEQIIGGLLQSANVSTISEESHILTRLIRAAGEKDFVERYGDPGEDEFDTRAGTIPQRLLLMNGNIVHERIREDLFNASSRIADLAPSDAKAVESAYLAVLTRRPTAEEARHFENRLSGLQGDERKRRLSDLYWTLINSTEFSWNH
jgi:hypothetical protein